MVLIFTPWPLKGEVRLTELVQVLLNSTFSATFQSPLQGIQACPPKPRRVGAKEGVLQRILKVVCIFNYIDRAV